MPLPLDQYWLAERPHPRSVGAGVLIWLKSSDTSGSIQISDGDEWSDISEADLSQGITFDDRTAPDAPGADKMIIYTRDDELYNRSGAAGAEVRFAKASEIFANPMTTLGDTVIGGASGVATRLAIGTAHQELAVNAGATAPAWANGILKTLTAAGDLAYASAANTLARLAKGTAFQELTMNAGATAPQWSSGVLALAAAAGDLFYATAANTLAKLSAGTAFQRLGMNAGATAPAWQSDCLTLAAAAGDMFYATAANVLAKLTKGTAYQELGMNAGATAPEWHTGVLATISAAGDLLYGSAANAVTRLAKGTAFQELTMNSGATAPQWSTGILALAAAAGDTFYATAANTLAKLTKGTAFQELTMNSGATAPQWSSGVLALAAAAGDTFYATAANTLAKLTKGTAFQRLGMNTGATAPEWQSDCVTVAAAAGDTFYASAANTIAKLTKGTARQALAMNAGATAPTWVDLVGSGTFLVAASNASTAVKAVANYVCDGTADDVDVAAAITALPGAGAIGGRIVLSEGTFTFSTMVDIPTLVTVAGMGQSTKITTITNFAATQTAIFRLNGAGAVLRDLLIDGNKANQSSGTCPGVQVNAVADCRVLNVTAQNCRGGGITGTGATDRLLISGCLSTSHTDAGFIIGGCTGAIVIGCIATSNANQGFVALGSLRAIFSGNYSASNTVDGFSLAVSSAFCQAIGNVTELNGRHGFFVGTSTDCSFLDNVCIANSQTTTLAAQNMQINSTRALIQGNTCRQGAASNKPAYGLSISGTDVIVGQNDLYDGGGTGEFTDAGTRTQRQVFSQVTVAGGDTINTTAAETNFATSKVFPADKLKHIGRVVRVRAWGTYGTLGSGTVTIQLKLKAGTTTLLDFGAITTAISIAARRWYVEADLTVVAVGASGSLECAGHAAIPTANDDVTKSRPAVGSTTTVDTTAAQTLQISAQHGASSSSNTIVLRQLNIEILN